MKNSKLSSSETQSLFAKRKKIAAAAAVHETRFAFKIGVLNHRVFEAESDFFFFILCTFD